jgi:hypothetical protein
MALKHSYRRGRILLEAEYVGKSQRDDAPGSCRVAFVDKAPSTHSVVSSVDTRYSLGER